MRVWAFALRPCPNGSTHRFPRHTGVTAVANARFRKLAPEPGSLHTREACSWHVRASCGRLEGAAQARLLNRIPDIAKRNEAAKRGIDLDLWAENEAVI